MICPENYWNFFSKRKLNEGDDVTFMEDGNFAITSSNGIEVYNEQCIKVFEHSGKCHAFENGLVVSVGDGIISVVFGNKDSILKPEKNSIKFSGDPTNDVTFLRNAVIVINPETCKYSLFAINTGVYPKLIFSGGSFPKRWKRAENGYFCVISSIFKNGTPIEVYKLFNEQGTELCLENEPKSIELLDCGSFIANYPDKSILYSQNLYELAQSQCAFGISDLGGYYVRFEDKLILNARHGWIFDEFDNRLLAVTPCGVKIYKNKFVKSEDEFAFRSANIDSKQIGFWLGGKFKFACDKVVLFFSGGYCYPLRFGYFSIKYTSNIYYIRLQEMMVR